VRDDRDARAGGADGPVARLRRGRGCAGLSHPGAARRSCAGGGEAKGRQSERGDARAQSRDDVDVDATKRDQPVLSFVFAYGVS
jgi:hypothetical protein